MSTVLQILTDNRDDGGRGGHLPPAIAAAAAVNDGGSILKLAIWASSPPPLVGVFVLQGYIHKGRPHPHQGGGEGVGPRADMVREVV